MSTAQIQLGGNEQMLRNADRLWHLRQVELVRDLTLAELNTVASSCGDQIFKKDEVIFRQGAPADRLYILNRGTVRQVVATPEGREKIVGVFKTGDVFGEDILSPDKVRQTQAIAHEETWLSLVTRGRLMSLLAEIPALNLGFLRMLNSKLVEARNEIENLSFNDTQHRIAQSLLKLSREHGRETVLQKSLKKLTIPLSHEHLAQLIGANRPHVSAIMSQFKKEGLIRYQKRKLLINVDELSKLVASKA